MFRIALGQIGARVGDVAGNVDRILAAWLRAADLGSDLVVFTELAVPGYPPEDLLLKPEFIAANLDAIEHLATHGPPGTAAVVGYVGRGEEASLGSDTQPDRTHWDVALATRDLTNAAAVLADGRIAATYDKLRLPNYGVFDEARYFSPRDRPCVVDIAGVPVGVTICEDLWTEHGPVHAAARAGAHLIANLNASPYHRGKRAARERWVRHHARRGIWVAYVNVVGGWRLDEPGADLPVALAIASSAADHPLDTVLQRLTDRMRVQHPCPGGAQLPECLADHLSRSIDPECVVARLKQSVQVASGTASQVKHASAARKRDRKESRDSAFRACMIWLKNEATGSGKSSLKMFAPCRPFVCWK
jgi:predicted amidohydrolase